MELGTHGEIRTPNAQGLSLPPLPIGLREHVLQAPRTGFEPAVFRSTGGCVDRYANEAGGREAGS